MADETPTEGYRSSLKRPLSQDRSATIATSLLVSVRLSMDPLIKREIAALVAQLLTNERLERFKCR